MAVVEVTVIVDTNVFANGDFSSSRLKKLVRRVEKKGHRLVVPLVVVWEWAEHAHSAHEIYRSQVARAAKRIDPLLFGAIDVPPRANIDRFVEIIANAVADAGAEIAEPPNESAIDAVRQQVLQIDHGVKVEGVKTGAADALLAATAESIAEESTGAVLVSADKHVRSLLHDPPRLHVVEGVPDLWSLLLAVAPAEDVVVARFEDYVLSGVRAELAEGKYPLPSATPDYDHHVEQVLDLRRDAELFDLTILDVSTVRAVDPEVVEDDDQRFLSAELILVGTVGAFSWRFGGPEDELVHEYGEGEVRIRVFATGDLDEEYSPVSYELDGPIRLEVTDTYWDALAEQVGDDFE